MNADERRGAMSLAPSYYEALRRLTLELAGVNLGTNHAFLVETRLSRLARDEGYASLEAMINELFKTGGSRLAVQVVSALTERDTHFFKDARAFSRLRETVIPDLHRKRGGGRVRLLSFGCASGHPAKRWIVPALVAIRISMCSAVSPFKGWLTILIKSSPIGS